MGAVGRGGGAASRINRGTDQEERDSADGDPRFCPENQKDGVPFLAWEGTSWEEAGYGEREVHLGHIELEASVGHHMDMASGARVA